MEQRRVPTCFLFQQDFYCQACDAKFTKKMNYQRHLRLVHCKPDRICEICGQVFTAVTSEAFSNHVLKCKQERYKCEVKHTSRFVHGHISFKVVYQVFFVCFVVNQTHLKHDRYGIQMFTKVSKLSISVLFVTLFSDMDYVEAMPTIPALQCSL